MNARDLSTTQGFAEPILWGLQEGYSIAEIAAGLSIPQGRVIYAIELWAPPWLARQVRAQWQHVHDAERAKHDPRYAAWSRAQRGVRKTLSEEHHGAR